MQRDGDPAGAPTPVAQGVDGEAWSPATIFVVTDHLNQLIVKNLFRRQGTAGALAPPGLPVLAPGDSWCTP